MTSTFNPSVPTTYGFQQGTSRGWAPERGRNRVAFVAPETLIRNKASMTGVVICVMGPGGEANLGALKTAEGMKWCEVTLMDGRKGYIPAETGIRTLKYVTLLDKQTELRSAPGNYANLIRQMRSGEAMLLLQTIQGSDGTWVRVRDQQGLEGYIGGSVKIKQYAARAQNTPQHDMMVGGLWCVGGILVTAITYSAASGGGHFVVAWGAILFGGIQFLKGLANLVK